MFKYRGFSFMGEYANRTADDPVAKNSDGTETGDIVRVGNGLNLATGYVFKSNWALAVRYSNITPDLEITGRNKSDQYTFGVSKFVVGHKLKVQTDVSFLDIQGETDILLYRLQVDLHF